MIHYGKPPGSDETEVTLFGPGYGEAIALHFGEGQWLLVDSCINPETRNPATSEYLDSLGVKPEAVRVIVASHWHDDHVGGLATLTAKYPIADLVISAVFNSSEALAVLSSYSGNECFDLSRGSKELFNAMESRSDCKFALHKTIVFDELICGRRVQIVALSPLSTAFKQSIAHLSQYLPHVGLPIGHVPATKPNFESVVLHIDFEVDAVLLGADLEDHGQFGWSALVHDHWARSRKVAGAYKIAHHGSRTGDCPGVWTSMLRDNCFAGLAPFTRGSVRLPTDDDCKRISGRTTSAFRTSSGTRKPAMDVRVLRRLTDVSRNVARVDTAFGAVRFRRRIDATDWTAELFGSAQSI